MQTPLTIDSICTNHYLSSRTWTSGDITTTLVLSVIERLWFSQKLRYFNVAFLAVSNKYMTSYKISLLK